MSYCCVTDVVTRNLEADPGSVKFPNLRVRLLKLMADDQQGRASESFFSREREIAIAVTKRERARIDEVLAILGKIKTPSAVNIGIDGSRAIWLIALHNFNYKDSGRLVLQKMRRLFYKNKAEVFYPGIPFLVDRIMVGSKQPIDPENLPHQMYGTQGLSFSRPDGTMQSKPFPIINPKQLQERRGKFDLAPKSPCKHYPQRINPSL